MWFNGSILKRALQAFLNQWNVSSEIVLCLVTWVFWLFCFHILDNCCVLIDHWSINIFGTFFLIIKLLKKKYCEKSREV